MKKAAVLQKIRDIGVIPVVRAGSAAEAVALADAIAAGGLPVLEIALTVPGALQVIEQLGKNPDLLVGAGSVLDAASARACLAAGARFIVSPLLDPDTVALCREREVAVMPGALTPTEIARAWTDGADCVKVFPVDAMGGASYIRSLKAPMPHLELVPTGGVTLATAASYIEAGAAAIGVGGELANRDALRRGQSGTITAAARAYVDAVRKARPTKH
jgi:2-dehydro-3-deoxyphosphogluconate aldolase / (4S)-4-hydroxy-2-oxoglutarate aldolase